MSAKGFFVICCGVLLLAAGVAILSREFAREERDAEFDRETLAHTRLLETLRVATTKADTINIMLTFERTCQYR